MIAKLSFKNYKAFLEGSLEFKPLTFLVGANSVGKRFLRHHQIFESFFVLK